VDTSREERLYDEYLDLLVQGRCEDPDAFAAARGEPSEALREHLRRMQRAAGVSAAAPPGVEEDLPFERLGEFRLIRKLGAGGMGVVYLAEQESLARQVALKVMRPELGGLHPAAARLEREARAVARLRHPNLVTLYSIGFDQGVRYLAMEFVEGRGLDELLAEADAAGRHLPVADVLRWIAEVARGLDYAHAEGVIHRDVKPSNIRITPGGRALLLDFGVARELDADRATLTDAVVGTPHYVAPEQIAGGRASVDGRTDVYSLGCTLYYCLTNSVPFAGDTLEQVFHRILNEDPPPARTLNPTLSRDVVVVTAKAMEKEPDRRYPSGAALADDLNALLEFRPITARNPGPVARLLKWSRRHRGAAAAVGTALVAVVVLAAILVGQRIAARIERREAARDTLERARSRIVSMREEHAKAFALERRVDKLKGERMNRYFEPAEDLLVDGSAGRIAALKRERERGFYEVLDRLRRAAALGAPDDAVRAVRAELYLNKYLEAVAVWDSANQTLYRSLVRENDPEGRLDAELTGRSTLEVRSDPAGAEVHVFRYREQAEIVPGGERRLVPVPVRGRTPVPPGSFALRVTQPHGAFREGDLILSVAGRPIRVAVFVRRGAGDLRRLDRLAKVDGRAVADLIDARWRGRDESREKAFEFARAGERTVARGASIEALGIRLGSARDLAEEGGVSAVTWRQGSRHEEALPAGLRLGVTSTPLFLGPESRVGRTPCSTTVEQGSYLVVIRAEGRETVRTPINVPRGLALMTEVRLLPNGTTPPGFVRVKGWFAGAPDLWIMEREVLMEEYVEFLNDPDVASAIAAAGEPIRYPRNPINVGRGGHLERDARGRFRVPARLRRIPVYGVSWDDAQAYARWKTRRAREAGLPWTFRLPTLEEWGAAAGAVGDRRFVFGNHYQPKWVSSCFSRPRPAPEPVLAYPIDESPCGVRDMAGGVSEWLDAWANRETGYRRYASGSWADGGPEGIFEIYGSNGLPADKTADCVGFRLVLDIEGTPR